MTFSPLECALQMLANAQLQVLLPPSSKVIRFLRMLQKHDYISRCHRQLMIVVEPKGQLNKNGHIPPWHNMLFKRRGVRTRGGNPKQADTKYILGLILHALSFAQVSLDFELRYLHVFLTTTTLDA